jgi:methyl-accepting chemotaxis protein
VAYHRDWEAYQTAFRGVLSAAEAQDADKATRIYFAAAGPLYGKVDGDLKRLGQVNDREAKRLNADIAATADSARTAALVLLLGALGIAAVVSLWISRGIKRGVREIVDRLGMLRDHDSADLGRGLAALAAGGRTVDVSPSTTHIERMSNDEIGDVARAVNAIRDTTATSLRAYNESRGQLGELVGLVSSSAQTLSAASQQLATTSDEAGRAVGEIATAVGDVAQGAERQVRAVEQARTATEEVASASTDSARNGQETARAGVQRA